MCLGQGAHSQSAALPPQRKEGMLGPRVVSVATFDKKTGQLVTRKRKQRTLDFQNPPGEERQLLPLVSIDRDLASSSILVGFLV